MEYMMVIKLYFCDFKFYRELWLNILLVWYKFRGYFERIILLNVYCYGIVFKFNIILME